MPPALPPISSSRLSFCLLFDLPVYISTGGYNFYVNSDMGPCAPSPLGMPFLPLMPGSRQFIGYFGV